MEVHHLPDISAQQTVFALATGLYHKANPRPSAFVIFSDVIKGPRESRGQALAIAIVQIKGSGTLVATEGVVNPRTGNVIVLWTWTPNHDAMRKWYQDELANRVEE